jgi:hypothetical protein
MALRLQLDAEISDLVTPIAATLVWRTLTCGSDLALTLAGSLIDRRWIEIRSFRSSSSAIS